ncbi:MAG: adenine-specific methyltransferase EcoRI family protein [Kiritimatiellae bacterium]|nr:adenine-specific methyltransferase EcoRI family protein [Kiritimatiellia bacterium]
MSDTTALQNAKRAKQDEFYTQYADIQTEMNAYLEYNPDTFRGKTVLLPCDDPEWSNFTRYFAENFAALGLKKLISTSYAPDAKREKYGILFDYAAEMSGEKPKNERGKIFVLDHDVTGDGKVNFEDIEWKYLDGDGDFRSAEVKELRDEADVVVTNPPFSLFREFLAWIMEAGKEFAIIGNRNAITYKEVFPLIKANRIWLDNPFVRGAGYFKSPIEVDKKLSYYNSHDYREGLIRVPGVRWFTNLEHGRRHQPLQLMTMADNIKYSRHKEVKSIGYRKYDNYDAIEVPFTDAIPSDYDGVMGVPISFLDKYCPDQFEIVGVAKAGAGDPAQKTRFYPEQIQVARDGRETTVTKLNDGPVLKVADPPEGEQYYKIGDEIFMQVYARILICRKRGDVK